MARGTTEVVPFPRPARTLPAGQSKTGQAPSLQIVPKGFFDLVLVLRDAALIAWVSQRIDCHFKLRHYATWNQAEFFFRMCSNFSSSATTSPDSFLTSTVNTRSIFGWDSRACLISPICSSDSRKLAVTLPRPGFLKRMVAALSQTM